MTGPVVIVTGASRGIGAHVARWLAMVGARLVLVARDEAKLTAVAAAAEHDGAECVTVVLDVADPAAAERIVATAVDRFGGLDGLVNNASRIEPVQRIEHADLEGWRRLYEVNLIAPLALTRAALPVLRASRGSGGSNGSGGRVVNVVSETAEKPLDATAAYATSKAALLQLTRVLAREEPDIIAFAYAPGPTDTDLMTHLRERRGDVMSPELAAAYRRLHEEGLLVKPEDTSRTLAWLAVAAPRKWAGRMVDHTEPEAKAAGATYFRVAAAR